MFEAAQDNLGPGLSAEKLRKKVPRGFKAHKPCRTGQSGNNERGIVRKSLVVNVKKKGGPRKTTKI